MNDALRREYALLDWLVAWRPPEPSVVASLSDIFDGDPPTEEMDSWLETLRDLDGRGLIKAHLVFGIFNSGVILTGKGRAETEARHERRDDPLYRATACRRMLLRWAYGAADATVATFLPSPQAEYEGGAFTLADVSAAVDYLVDEGLLNIVDGVAADGSPSRALRLTARGRRHLEGDASGPATSSNTVNVYGDNHGPVYVGNRDVTVMDPVTRQDAGPEAADAAAEHEPASFQPPQFERWSVLAQAYLALHARDQRSVYDSPSVDADAAEFRFIWRIACAPLPESLRAKQVSVALLGLLSGPEMMNAVSQHVDVGGLTWSRHGDYGKTSFGAVLRSPHGTGTPTAWARLNPPPPDEYPSYGREHGCADLEVAVRFGDGGGPAGKPASITDWAGIFTSWLGNTTLVAAYLTSLGLDLSTEPVTRAAVAISTQTDLSDIADVSSIPRIPGTSISRWFHAVAVANMSGTSASGLGAAWLTTVCEDVLHLDDFDSALGQ